jgi:hypothetical protein
LEAEELTANVKAAQVSSPVGQCYFDFSIYTTLGSCQLKERQKGEPPAAADD